MSVFYSDSANLSDEGVIELASRALPSSSAAQVQFPFLAPMYTVHVNHSVPPVSRNSLRDNSEPASFPFAKTGRLMLAAALVRWPTYYCQDLPHIFG